MASIARVLSNRTSYGDQYIYALRNLDMRKILNRMEMALNFPTLDTKVVLYEYDKDMMSYSSFYSGVSTSLHTMLEIPGRRTVIYTRRKITGRGVADPRRRQVVVVWEAVVAQTS
jgi:hypothetical protein